MWVTTVLIWSSSCVSSVLSLYFPLTRSLFDVKSGESSCICQMLLLLSLFSNIIVVHECCELSVHSHACAKVRQEMDKLISQEVPKLFLEDLDIRETETTRLQCQISWETIDELDVCVDVLEVVSDESIYWYSYEVRPVVVRALGVCSLTPWAYSIRVIRTSCSCNVFSLQYGFTWSVRICFMIFRQRPQAWSRVD